MNNNDLCLVNDKKLQRKNIFFGVLDIFRKKEQENTLDIDDILELLNNKIRNEYFSSFITNGIFEYRFRKGKVIINRNELVILEKNGLDYFKVVVNPSFENFSEIIATRVQWDGHDIDTRRLVFKDNYIFMDRYDETKMRTSDSPNIIGIRVFQETNIYLDNELIYNYNLWKDDTDGIEIKESELYVLEDKTGYQREHIIRGSEETFSFNQAVVNEIPYNSKDIEENVFGYSTSKGTIEEFAAFLEMYKSQVPFISDLNVLRLKNKTDI